MTISIAQKNVCFLRRTHLSLCFLLKCHSCFLKPGFALYFGVMLPVGLILTTNLVIFVMVSYRLTCGRWAISANKNTSKPNRRLLQDLVALTVLLGLTWIFGFLAIGGARFLFNVLFLIFNSLQGLSVFLMFGVRQETVREQWKVFIRCKCCNIKSQRWRSEPPTSTVLTKSSDTLNQD